MHLGWQLWGSTTVSAAGGPPGSQRCSPNATVAGKWEREVAVEAEQPLPHSCSEGHEDSGRGLCGCPLGDSVPGRGTTTRIPTLSSRTRRCGPLVRSRPEDGVRRGAEGRTASALRAVVGSVPALDAADAPILGRAPIAACAGGQGRQLEAQPRQLAAFREHYALHL